MTSPLRLSPKVRDQRDGSYTASELYRRELQAYDAQRLTVRCLFCRWRFTGRSDTARARALEHRLAVHPKTMRGKKRRAA